MSCAPISPYAPPSVAFMFPGTKGDKGDKGDPGPASTVPGPQGPQGPFQVYTGQFASGSTYYDSEARRDVVFYNGAFWATNNPSKNGDDTWNSPNVSDWVFVGDTYVNVATALDLLVASNIRVGLNFIDPAYMKSNNFVAQTSGWLLTGLGRFEAYDSLINGLVSTNTPKFNLASTTRTMPPVGYAELDIAAIVDADIPVNPTINNVTDDALIFWGWLEGANTYLKNRFGNEEQVFQIILEGIGTNTSAGTDLFYIQVYYRTRTDGGSWGSWTVIGQDWYMQKLAALSQSFNLVKTLKLTLAGNNDIQFSAGFSKGASGTCSVDGAKISVEAFN